MSTKLNLAVILSVLLLGACSSIPGLYRIDIQQGNVIDQVMIDKLKPGMDKNQVHFILGTPAVVDPFHSDQWEYLFTSSEGGGNREQRHLRIHFKDEKLAYIDGDITTTNRAPDDTPRQSRTVEVPLDYDSGSGFFRRILNKQPSASGPEAEVTTPEENQ